MNHEGRIRDMERAAVGRWFAASALGPMFDAGRGRMLPMSADAVEPWRQEAYAIIDQYLIDARPPPQGVLVAIILGFSTLLFALEPILHLDGATIGGVMMGGLMLWHLTDYHRLWRYKRDLRALRGRIAASLALRTPLPVELGRRFRRGNPWRTALQIWVVGLTLLLLAAFHFLPPDRVTPAMMLAALGAVGIAWLLYFLSRRVDLADQAGSKSRIRSAI